MFVCALKMCHGEVWMHTVKHFLLCLRMYEENTANFFTTPFFYLLVGLHRVTEPLSSMTF